MASKRRINSVAKVPGVLKVNEDTREEMMRRIYWKDRQYLQYGSGLAEYVTLKDRSVSPITEGKSLVDFTHDRKSDYSENIDRKYKLYIEDAYEVEPLGEDLKMWEGDYLMNFTKWNKLSGVGDLMYAQGMTFMNYANSDRHVKEKYLTPDLTAFYGTSPIAEGDIRRFSIFAKGGLKDSYNNLSDEYKRASGRIPDIPEAQGASIKHDYVAGEPDFKNNGGNYYLEEQLNATKTVKVDGKDISKPVALYKPDRVGGENRYSDEKLSTKFDTFVHNGRFDDGKNDSIKLEYDEFDRETEVYHREEVSGHTTVFNGNNLLTKTNILFKQHKISTLMGRFHTSVGENGVTDKGEITDTAKSSMYGNSHGRNLLKLKPDKTNGYDNPYCRVWTYHHQYDRVNKLIRPFMGEKGVKTIESIQAINNSIRAQSPQLPGSTSLDGGKYLADNTVLSNSGFVNIVPSNDISNPVNIKKCMFSIENLAWKDVLQDNNEYNLSKEQRGPNGGRIMWFPPYDLDFQENITVDWDQNEFIGRGEKVYTYKNTTRTGTLSFTLLIDHPGVIDTIKNKTKYGVEDNIDNDYQAILRFFAGCETLEDWYDDEEKTDNPIEKDNNNDEGKEVPSKETARKIKFYVYFPNNYSGNMGEISEKEWNIKGYSDEDWYYYLLLGNGTSLGTDSWKGYEVKGLGNATAGTEIKPNPTINTEGCAKKSASERDCCQQWKLRTETSNKGPYNYRVDFDLKQELRYKHSNYTDTANFNLNNKVDTSISPNATHSFAEVVVALISGDTRNANEIYSPEKVLEHCELDPERIKELTKLFSSKIKSITVMGCATEQDSKPRIGCNETNADMLAHRRAKAVGRILKDMLLNRTSDGEKANFSDGEILRIGKLKDKTDTNTKEAKAQRCAIVEIEYNSAEINKVSEASNADNNGSSANITQNKETSNEANSESSMKTTDKKNGKPTSDATSYMATINYSKLRYETEAEYFDKLSTTDPFTFENLKKRFKYFTPAFHSISPEGFNARLTFLQQCTRQGHTIESSANVNGYRKTAGNLAFGRMPVCVLRLGDFINTRILINNVTINYQKEGMQWDLNPEGAGVQPMFATVSMGITILGGQSLSGPISRLQNAVSFNYYANTGVYDNRADRVSIENGKETYTNLWTPMLENKQLNTNVNNKETEKK